MPTRRLMRTAATASMVSTTRTNRAVRKSINQGPQQQTPNSSSRPDQSELTSTLEELQALRDRGILTQEEFDAKKKKVLGI